MTPLAISVIVLWIVVLALLAVVLALTRQLGVLHERIAPVGALMLNRGLAVGERAPAMDVAALDGTAIRIGGASRRRQEHAAPVRIADVPRVQISIAHRQIQRQARRGIGSTSFWRATATRTSIANMFASTGSAAFPMSFPRRSA